MSLVSTPAIIQSPRCVSQLDYGGGFVHHVAGVLLGNEDTQLAVAQVENDVSIRHGYDATVQVGSNTHVTSLLGRRILNLDVILVAVQDVSCCPTLLQVRPLGNGVQVSVDDLLKVKATEIFALLAIVHGSEVVVCLPRTTSAYR